MNKLKGYIAGSLFSEAEVAQRLKEGQLLRENVPTVDWFNPIEAPINDKSKLPTAESIFLGDTKAILDSDFIIADLSNNDAGVMYELGVAWGLQHAYTILNAVLPNLPCETWHTLFNKGIKPRNVQTVLSDIRIPTSHKYEGHYIPMSFNQYVIGGIEDMDGVVNRSFQDALDNIIKEVK